MSTTNHDHHIYVLMGVSGSGKSAVASEVAHQLHAAFLDGDFLHPRRNIEKMASGEPLNDDDRKPWLQALNDAAFAMQRTNKVSLIVCSALKKHYRDLLREGNPNLSFIYLKGDFDVIESRLKARKGHFFKTQMLVTQFERCRSRVRTKLMYWWWISINRWKVLWQAPLRLLEKRQISSDYINACFNSSRVCFTAAVFSHEGAYARFPGFDGGVHGGWPFFRYAAR